METITLKDGTEIELSKESYDALARWVQKKKKKWQPEHWESFWIACSDWTVDTYEWDWTSFDEGCIETNNAFYTEKEAKLKALFLKSLVPNTARKGENFYVWNFAGNCTSYENDYTWIAHLQPKFEYEREALDWWGKYKEAWINQFNK